jgi:hypothetical protein
MSSGTFKSIKFFLTILIIGIFTACKNAEFVSSTIKTPEYKAINDRISEMSLEEKVGQT